MICSSHYLPLDKSCFLATKDSYVTACLRMFTVYFESEITQCIFLHVSFYYVEYDSILC